MYTALERTLCSKVKAKFYKLKMEHHYIIKKIMESGESDCDPCTLFAPCAESTTEIIKRCDVIASGMEDLLKSNILRRNTEGNVRWDSNLVLYYVENIWKPKNTDTIEFSDIPVDELVKK